MNLNQKYIHALELERAGDWNRAHILVQDIDTAEAAWIHAYLHRVEGDPGNACYWYRQAGKAECTAALEDEWQEIFNTLG
jgi:hypothetical protein